MKDVIVLKGYTPTKEVYAIKKEYPVITLSRIVEVPETPEIKDLYSSQKSKFTKRRTWGAGWLNKKSV